MRYQYRLEADSSRKYSAKQMTGTPRDLELYFDNVHVRVYKSHEVTGYFRCSLAVPAFEDDEGYVREFEFCDPLQTYELEHSHEESIPSFESDLESGSSSYLDYYEAPFNEHDFGTLVQAMSARLSLENKGGRKLLSFQLEISGTPFKGYVIITPDLYREITIVN